MITFDDQGANPMAPRHVLIGLLISAACPASALSQVEREHGRPHWVSRRPTQDGYYVGIGVARREESLPASRDRALNSALENIAAQIETEVSGEMHVSETERGGQVRGEYRAEIMTIVSATLEGIEIVDTWDDSANCWVYARLSIEHFERLRQERIERARRTAFDCLTRADEAAPEAKAEQLALYLRALGAVRGALGDPLRVQHRGRTMTLDTEIPLRIQALLSSIELEASPVEDRIKQGTAVDVPIAITAWFRDDEGNRRAVKGMPVRFVFERGRGDLVARVWTGPQGVAASQLRAIHDPASHQVVRATIDLASFPIPDLRDATFHRQLEEFAIPFTLTRLNVLEQTVYVITDESNLGHPLAIPHLQAMVKRHLGEMGMGLVDRPGQADLAVEISARTRPGGQYGEVCFAFLDLVISVTNHRDVELFHTALTNIKGSGVSHEQAGLAAFRKAGEPLTETVLPAMSASLSW